MPANKHLISLTDAARLTERYRRNVPKDTSGSIIQPIAVSFDKEAIDFLTEQRDYNGLKVYFALNERNEMTAVLVAIDQNGDDIIGQDSIILDHGTPCPVDCGSPNALNS